MRTRDAWAALLLATGVACTGGAVAQVPPTPAEVAAYTGLHAAAAAGDVRGVEAELANGVDPDLRDGRGRTALHVAAHAGRRDVMAVLVAGGADPNALDGDRYDIVTIAAVANDVKTLRKALALGTRADNITSRYDGTALIAAAHLGHVDPVKILIDAGAPLDHVNNLGWTALIEAIVLGDGGPRHRTVAKLLLDAGADVHLPDANGRTPRDLAAARGYEEMVAILDAAGAR